MGSLDAHAAQKAIELGDKISLSFNRSKTGIPYPNLNFKTGKATKDLASVSEFTTLQLEFKYLSILTGNKTYWELSESVYKTLYSNETGLVMKYENIAPIIFNPDTGQFATDFVRIGSRGDSFYEYLLKQYLLTHDPLYYKRYRQSIDSIKKYLIKTSYPSDFIYIAEKPDRKSVV